MSPRKPSRKTLTVQLDRVCSLLARERNGGACEVCARPANQVHHVVGRLNRRLRFDERNLVAMCPGCHFWAEGYPPQFMVWFERRRPDDYAYVLDSENTKVLKRADYELAELLNELSDQLREEAA